MSEDEAGATYEWAFLFEGHMYRVFREEQARMAAEGRPDVAVLRRRRTKWEEWEEVEA